MYWIVFDCSASEVIEYKGIDSMAMYCIASPPQRHFRGPLERQVLTDRCLQGPL